MINEPNGTVCSALKAGQILESGFEILEVKDLVELKALGIWARHQKSGAEVFHVYNDDSENLFGFAFATAPEDSTGAAHILEHSVLCGSKNYPLKDAFLVLAQGSLQTFLNAWTFPDKTVYPASSVNEQDYFNLMSVYGDAVFRPLLSEWTFLQEGHRLSFSDDEGEDKTLSITGVVYNEMKGAYSSMDTYAGLWSVKALVPGTPYDFESGGDPHYIPDLSWEGLKDFHRNAYSPANCRVFLAGNIPTEKQLAFLDKNFFANLPVGKKSPPIPQAACWEAPRSFNVPCPSGADQKPSVLLSWLCGDSTDINQSLDLAALAEILLGHDGSPLTKALIESGLGEDLSPVSGLEGELRQTSFCTGLRGILNYNDGKSAKQVEALILDTLKRLVEEGIPKDEIEAALLGMEFSQREIRRAGGPFSLVWMRRSLRTWLHGANPYDSLLFDPAIADLKRRIANDPRYFETLIRRYLLDNPHRALIVIEPTEGFQEAKDKALELKLSEINAALTEAERKELVKKAEKLKLHQETKDSAQALASIPHLSRNDLKPHIESIKREYAVSGAPMVINPIFTNGISYVNLAFPVDVLSPEDYLWLPFYARAVVSVGLPGMSYGEVSTLLARTSGGFHAMLHSGSSAPGAEKTAHPFGACRLIGRDWLISRLKALDEKLVPSLDLALRLITEADFSDERRLRDLALEMKNDLDSSLAPSGHLYASGCSGRLFSRSRCIEELWNGLDQIFFAHQLVEMDVSQIRAKLQALQDRLANSGILVNLAGSATAAAQTEIGSRFGTFGMPHAPNPETAKAERFRSLGIPNRNSSGSGEVYSSAALQVGFAAISLTAAPYGSPLHAAELVLSHQLSTGELWESIRMKGGAYGVFANPDSLEGTFSFATYRDPNPYTSLEAFSSILKDASSRSAKGKESNTDDEDALTKAIIGSFARETRPRSPAEKSMTDFFRFLYGIEDSYRLQRIKDIVAVQNDQLHAVLQRLAAETNGKDSRTSPVIISGIGEAEKAALKLGVSVCELPL